LTRLAADLIERSRTEEKLRESEERLILAQSAANLGVWERDLRTNVITVSGEYTKLYGLAPDRTQLTLQEWVSLIHPDDRQRVEEVIRGNRLDPSHILDTEFRVMWPDGSVHWLLGKGTVFFDDLGQPVRRVGVNLDITKQKQAEAALRESEERFRATFFQ